jgi:peptidoglycan/LPS O-acetylase OafA/YrhL
VISGYLITRILLAPDFTFAGFYRRRVRRLAPALLLVVATTLCSAP